MACLDETVHRSNNILRRHRQSHLHYMVQIGHALGLKAQSQRLGQGQDFQVMAMLEARIIDFRSLVNMILYIVLISSFQGCVYTKLVEFKYLITYFSISALMYVSCTYSSICLIQFLKQCNLNPDVQSLVISQIRSTGASIRAFSLANLCSIESIKWLFTLLWITFTRIER